MEHIISLRQNMREEILQGAAVLKSCICATLGPCGRHVMLQHGRKETMITNDGVSIAKHLVIDSPIQNMAVNVLRESAAKTNEEAGDGTTTSILLAVSMLEKGFQAMKEHANPYLLVQGMELARDQIITYLDGCAKKLTGYDDIEKIASISSKSKEIGTLIAEAYTLVEQHSYIHVETSSTIESKVRLEDGMQLHTRVLSYYFFRNKKEIIYDNASILITNQNIESIAQIEHLLGYFLANGKPLIILCKEMSEEVLRVILYYNIQKNSSIIAYKAPSFGDYQNDILDDVALLCHGTLQSEELDMDISKLTPEDLGTCEKAILSRTQLHIFEKKNQLVNDRIKYLKDLIPSLKQSYDISQVYQRICNLEGKLACIEVGGYTQSEIEEKKMRMDDALQATRAAQEEGIVWGGGLAFLEAYRSLHPALHAEQRDVELGIQIIFHACLQPFLQICENAYLDGETMLRKQLALKLPMGYDASSMKWVNMEENGIMDPLKVVKQALVNAVSVSSLLIRCDVAIHETSDL